MTYSGYCNLNNEELYFDNIRVAKNREMIIENTLENGREVTYGFVIGAGFMLLCSPMPAFAKEPVEAATSEAQKELAKRLSNAMGCGAVMSVCGKVLDKSGAVAAEQIAKEAALKGNIKIAAGIACGIGVGWCAKYVIFDR